MKIQHHFTALLFTFIILQGFFSVAQVDPYPFRGLYLNKFINYADPLGTNTILGWTQREDEALQFAKDNNFKRLDLVRLNEIFYPVNHLGETNPASNNTYEDDLCSFIQNAKDNYCIEQIGAVGSSEGFFDDVNVWNTLHITPAYNFSTSNIPNIETWGSSFNFVENTYTPEDGSIALVSEYVKFFLRIVDSYYNPSGVLGQATCQFNVFTIEYEYWNTNDWSAFTSILGPIHTLQQNTSVPFQIHVYTLLRDIPGATMQQEADYIDQYADKIYLTDYPYEPTYTKTPDDFWNLYYFRDGMEKFGSNAYPNTVITPLFNNMDNVEGIYLWLNDVTAPENTLFTAEEIFLQDMTDANNFPLIGGDNVITPGSFQWFKYTEFPHVTSNFLNPYCTNNELFYVAGQPLICDNPNIIDACSGVPVTFTNLGNYEPGVSAEWNFGDGSAHVIGPMASQIHSFNQPGTYTVNCTLTFPPNTLNNAPCGYEFERTVEVAGASITPSGTTTFCQGGSVLLTASNGSSWSWTTPSGGHPTTQGITATEDGDYTVTVQNSNGCATSTPLIHVTVHSNPTPAIIPGNSAICAGSSIQLDAGAGYSSYSWSNGPNTQTINVSAAGNYSVTVTDGNSCTGTSAPVTITVNQNPTPTITALGNTTFCAGGSVNLDAGNGYSLYSWSNGSNTQIVNITTSGNYSVTVTDANGCTGTSSSVQVTVNPIPSVTASATSLTVCLGGTINLFASTGASSPTFQWSGPNGFNLTTQNPVISNATLGATGNYTVTVTSNNCTSPSSNTVAITVDATCCGDQSTWIDNNTGIISSGTYSTIKNLSNNAEIQSGAIVYFNNLDLSIAKGKKITVKTGGYLEIKNSSVLHSCADMWQGIVVETNATLKVLSSSVIKDAVTGTDASGGCTLTVNTATYSGNYISVKLHDGSFSNAHFTNSTYECPNILKPPYGTAVNLYTFNHFLINDATNVTIGEVGNPGNNFLNANYGIQANRSDIIIDNNIFDMSTNTSARYAIFTYGWSTNFALFYTAKIGDNAFNTFNNYSGGILVNGGYNADINNNVFQNNGICINANNGESRLINIYDNTLKNFTGYGILLTDNHNSNIHVERNLLNSSITTFAGAAEAQKGIYVANTTVSRPSLTVKENRIKNCRYGIQIINQDNCYVTANKIYFLVSDADILAQIYFRNGIVIQGCYSHAYGFIVSYNEIYRTCGGCTNTNANMKTYLNGISINQSWVDVYENYVTFLPTALMVTDNCAGTFFHCNWFDNSQQGYVWGLNAGVPDQGSTTWPTNNQWTNWGVNNRIEGLPLHVKWYYDNTAPAPYNPHPFQTGCIDDWYYGYNNKDCFAIYPEGGGGGGGHQGSLINTIGKTDYDENLFENKYQDNSSVYEDLKNNLQLMYAGTTYDADLQNFFTLTALSNIGILSDVKEYLNDNDKASAFIANESLIPDNLMEANAKFVNSICINSQDTITYDSLQRAQLVAIAYQIPIIGGEAVYRARAILKLDVDDTQLQYRLQGQPSSFISGYSLFPNPNSGIFTIACTLDEKETATVEVNDEMGRTVTSRVFNSDTKMSTFDLTSQFAGIYFVKLSSSKGNTKIWKVVILNK